MKIRDIIVEGKVIVGPWAGSNDAVSAPIEKIARVKNPTASDWIKTPLRAFRSRRLISKYKRLANDAFEKSLEEMEKADRYEWTDPERFSHEKIYIKYLGLNRYFSMLAGDEEREFNPKAIMHYQGKYPELKQMYDADMQQEINTLTERKRKRKRKTTQTVYGGWWGGYPLDNSSGESGGEGAAESMLAELAPGTGGGGSNGEWFTWLAKLDKELKKVNFAPLSYRHSFQVWETMREDKIKVGIFFSGETTVAMASVMTMSENKDFKILPNIQSILMILYTVQSLDSRRIQGAPPVYLVKDGKSIVGFFRDGDGFISINPKYSSSKTLPDGNLRIDFGRDTMTEASSAAQQAAIAINMKRVGKKPKHNK